MVGISNFSVGVRGVGGELLLPIGDRGGYGVAVVGALLGSNLMLELRCSRGESEGILKNVRLLMGRDVEEVNWFRWLCELSCEQC